MKMENSTYVYEKYVTTKEGVRDTLNEYGVATTAFLLLWLGMGIIARIFYLTKYKLFFIFSLIIISKIT